MAGNQGSKPSKSVTARIQGFDPAANDYADILLNSNGNITVSISGTISATVAVSAVVSAIQVKDTFTSAGSNSNLAAGTAITLAHNISDSTFLRLRPRDGSIYWDWNSGVSVSASSEILKNEPATWNFAPELTGTIFITSSATAVDVRKSVG